MQEAVRGAKIVEGGGEMMKRVKAQEAIMMVKASQVVEIGVVVWIAYMCELRTSRRW